MHGWTDQRDGAQPCHERIVDDRHDRRGRDAKFACPSTLDYCPVTLPNRNNPRGRPAPSQASPLSYGNEHLWVEVYPRGIIRPTNYGRARPDGTQLPTTSPGRPLIR